MITEDTVDQLRDRWVMARKEIGLPLPLILYEEVYVYFGNWCKIVEANVYDEIPNAEVTIEGFNGTRTVVEFSELSWRFERSSIDAMQKKSQHDFIVEGP